MLRLRQQMHLETLLFILQSYIVRSKLHSSCWRRLRRSKATNEAGRTPISYASGQIVDVLLEHSVKQGACSWSLVCEVLSLDNQEQVVKILDMWPRKAFMEII